MERNGKPAVSVIVPVYQCEKYIRTCIKSILVQTFTDFELLLVLDGEVDSSPQICRDLAQTDGRVGVLAQENQGPAAARNNGLDHAAGEYILFLDSDDWIEADCLEKLVRRAEQAGCDIVICGYFLDTAQGAKPYSFFRFDERVFREEDKLSLCTNCLAGDKRGVSNAPSCAGATMAKMYRRSLIERNGLRFPLRISFGEDSLFTLQAFWLSASTVLIADRLYHCRMRNDSISHSYRADMLAISEYICDTAWKFRKQIARPEWDTVCRDRWITALFDVIKLQLVPPQCKMGRREKVKKLREIAEAEDKPYKRVRQSGPTYLTGHAKVFRYLLRFGLYWPVYLYCEWKYGTHPKVENDDG